MRLVLAFVAVFGVIAVISPGLAVAAPVSTTLVLSCDRGVLNADVVVTVDTARVQLTCGTESTSGLRMERVKIPINATTYAINTFFVDNGTTSGGCLGGGIVPAKINCPSTGPQATLTIR